MKRDYLIILLRFYVFLYFFISITPCSFKFTWELGTVQSNWKFHFWQPVSKDCKSLFITVCNPVNVIYLMFLGKPPSFFYCNTPSSLFKWEVSFPFGYFIFLYPNYRCNPEKNTHYCYFDPFCFNFSVYSCKGPCVYFLFNRVRSRVKASLY